MCWVKSFFLFFVNVLNPTSGQLDGQEVSWKQKELRKKKRPSWSAAREVKAPVVQVVSGRFIW